MFFWYIVAGLLYDQTKSYTFAFFLAGIPPICGAVIMCLINFVKDEPDNFEDIVDHQLEIALAKPAWTEGKIILFTSYLQVWWVDCTSCQCACVYSFETKVVDSC